MTTRYITEGEKAGVKRRMAEWRARMREAGMKPREVWATDAEAAQIKAILAAWRGDRGDLNSVQIEAVEILKLVL